MKNILYISYDGITDPLGQSQILPYLIELAKKGYEFTILSFEKRKRYYSPERSALEEKMMIFGIKWVPLFFTSRPPVLSKIYDRWRMKRTAIKLLKQKKFEATHCRSYIAAEVGFLLKKKKSVKFIFDMRGFWADEKVECGQWNQKKFIYRKIYQHYKKKEKEFLLNADFIITLTNSGKDEILSNATYKDVKIEVIPCCADLDHFDYNKIEKLQKSDLRKKIGISPDKKIITYLGSVGGWYMTFEMFSFYKQLLLAYPNFLMLILTKDDPEFVKKEAEAVGINSTNVFVIFASRSEIPAFLSISDCSIFFIRPTYSKIASSPTKHAELMGMGIPVICNDIGDTGRVIKETKTGIVIKQFDNENYKNVISQLPILLSIQRASIRDAAFQYFDLGMGVAKYLNIYRKLSG
ncbi:MAG: glycosyltransferase family 4 protein [Candidatus Staskawiczbacteria bacterium]|nr:glycosyltransferase family 4 protein [Candidatus Staskawiczbacteria bacterium]